MAGTTTAFCTSAKKELMQSGHNFSATKTPTGGVVTNASFAITSLSAVTDIAVGAPITATGIPAGAVTASIDSASQVTSSKAGTSTPGAQTVTFAGDAFKIALIKVSPTGTYGAASTNYSNITGNSDEVSGTGYTAGGQALANNITPATGGTTAFTSWSSNPSWTSSTFSTTAAMIYNTAARLEGTANRSISTHDFGGTQTVSAGTFTLIFPTNDQTNAILRVT